MTLNVSLLVPDGIVIGSDSLMTLSERVSQKMNVDCVCPSCKQGVQIPDVQVPPYSVPSSTFPYAQKLFSILGRFGVAVHGAAFLNGRSIYNHIQAFSGKVLSKISPEGLVFDRVRDELLSYFQTQLENECLKTGLNLALQPDHWTPLGFQVVGFSEDANGDPIAQVFHVQIGKKPRAEHSAAAALCTGETAVVSMIWPKGNTGANFSAFSLQDAIDYVKFLIRTTSDYQRFTGKLPSVGGEIDIALITNHRGFRWIAQKELYRMLDKEV